MKPKILIVDDNPKNLQVLGSALQMENYQIEFATNGKTALNWIKDEKFDLILLDVMMPEMNGFEVCKKIRKNQNNYNLPIIFLTAKSEPESVIEGFNMGGQDYVTKPFDAAELLARVKTQLELKFSREKLANMNQHLEEQVDIRTKELKKANRELEKLDEVKTDFLNMLSHEIRTPLSGILGPLQLIKSKIENEELLKLLQMLDDSVERLERFSYIALLITRLKSQKYKIELSEFSLLELLGYVTTKQHESIANKKITINTNKLDKDFNITADRELINQLLDRIFENSLHYSPEGGSIEFIGETEGTKKIFELRDHGNGFPENFVSEELKLFNPGEKHISKNIGISLFLAKLIMDQHNGDIQIFNASDGGAVVKLIFED